MSRKELQIRKAVSIDNSPYMKNETELRIFQKEGVQFLRFSWACILAFPTGLGKTVTSLSAYTYLKSRKNSLKLIYVSEKTILPQTAYEDLPKFFQNLKLDMIFENTPKQRDKIYQGFIDNDLDILFLNYHTMRNDQASLTDLYRLYEGNIITIFDEADNIAGDSGLSKSANHFAKLSYRVWALTATPSRSNLEHIHNIFTNIGNKVISQTEFKSKHCIIENKLFGQLSIDGKKLGNLFGQPNPIGVSFMGGLRKYIYEAKYYHRVVIKQNLQKGKISLFDDKKMTFRLTVPNNFVGRDYFIIVMYNDKKKQKKQFVVTFSAFPNVSILGYKNISGYIEKTKGDLFVKSKRDVAKDIPPFTVHKLYFKEDKQTFNKMRDYYDNTEVPSSAKCNICLSMPQLIELEEVDNDIPYLHQNHKIKEVLRITVKVLFEEEKVIVYSPYRTVIERLVEIMIDSKVIDKKSFNIITGASNDKAVQKKQFVEDENRKVMFITDAGLKGLNLQVANNLIAVNLPKTAGDLLQLAGRISRIGTKYKNLNIWLPMHEASYDIDCYNNVFSQLAFVHRLNPSLVDGGLYDSSCDPMDEKEADIFLLKSMKNRKAKYLK